MHNEEHALHLPSPDPPELEPIHAELANGHAVKIEARFWQRWRSYEDWAAGIWPEPVFAIRIYCTEGALPKRLVWREELRKPWDFSIHDLGEIWKRLAELAASRAIYDFDGFDEFLHRVIEDVGHDSAQEPDATEHFSILPCLTAPEAFDRIDDSIFTDQHDLYSERSTESST